MSVSPSGSKAAASSASSVHFDANNVLSLTGTNIVSLTNGAGFTLQYDAQGCVWTNTPGTGAHVSIGAGSQAEGLYSPGTGRLGLAASGLGRWEVNASGHFLAILDNTYDIGASGATRPRSIYAGTAVNIGSRGQAIDITTPFAAGCLRGQGTNGAALRGNRAAADTANGPDVFMDTLNTRTAGFIFAAMNNGNRRFSINYEGRAFVTVPNSAPVDADLQNSEVTWYLDEAANTLKARIKYAAGTLKSLTTALALS